MRCFQRAVEIGVALGGATQTRHLFGRRINRRYQGRLETLLERRDEGFPVLRAYYKSSYVKQYEKGDRLLRTETCLNDTYHLGIGRKLDNLPAIRRHLAATTDPLPRAASGTARFHRRSGRVGRIGEPGDDREASRTPESSCTMTASSACSMASSTPVACSATGRRGNCTRTSWLGTVSARRTTRSASSATDLGKLRAHGLVERVGRSRRYRLTPDGVRLGALLVKIRTRLLGPLFADSTLAPTPRSDKPQHRGGRTAHRRPSPRHPLRHPRAYDGCCLTARPPPPSSCRAPHRQPAQFAQNRQFGRTRRLVVSHVSTLGLSGSWSRAETAFMPQKKYIVRLTDEEREICRKTVRKLKASSEKVRRAQILLKADADGPGWTDQQIADALSCRTKTVENVRQRCVQEGFERALERKRRPLPPGLKRLDGEQEAQVIALRLGTPPKGYASWSLRLLARRVVELAIVGSVSHETIRRTLKKNGMTQRKVEYWVIPPQADAEFVAHMEQVLDRYQQPYDPDCPVVCMDEQPVQLVQETRPPVAATATRPRRVDYEYERAGTASVFLFSEPLAGWRQATARARRTKADWAVEVAGLLEGRYADCPRVTLVCDNLNTHTKGAFYEVFEPVRARELVRRLEFCHTPKHGSWLNIAENELSALTRQCLRGRRIGDLETLHREVSAWSGDVNGTQRGVDWQMKVNDARCKLKSVYPKIVT